MQVVSCKSERRERTRTELPRLQIRADDVGWLVAKGAWIESKALLSYGQAADGPELATLSIGVANGLGRGWIAIDLYRHPSEDLGAEGFGELGLRVGGMFGVKLLVVELLAVKLLAVGLLAVGLFACDGEVYG